MLRGDDKSPASPPTLSLGLFHYSFKALLSHPMREVAQTCVGLGEMCLWVCVCVCRVSCLNLAFASCVSDITNTYKPLLFPTLIRLKTTVLSTMANTNA